MTPVTPARYTYNMERVSETLKAIGAIVVTVFKAVRWAANNWHEVVALYIAAMIVWAAFVR